MPEKQNNESSRPIGVFDSGVGGLTVVRELGRLLPNEKIIYFGDTGRVPYGNKSKETIINYSLQIAYFLMKKKIKMLVVACNTASSFSINSLKRHLHIPIIGVIEPGAKAAIESTLNSHVGVIGTFGTISSNAYKKALKKVHTGVNVSQQSCSLFVQLAEDGWLDNKVAQSVADEYLKVFHVSKPNKKIDTLILGCTHYPLLKNVIQKSIGSEVCLIDSGKETAKEVKRILEKKKLLNTGTLNGKDSSTFYVSDFPHKFREISQRFLSKKLTKVYKVKL